MSKDNNNSLNEWIKFLSLKSKEEMIKLKESTDNDDIKKAIYVLEELQTDEKTKYEYLKRLEEIAIDMLREGFDISEIINTTNLSVDEILKLKKKIQIK